MAFTMASFIELFLYGILLVLFMVFFGIPSVQKYQRKETIFLSSRESTNGIEAPAVTFLALSNSTGYGWKTKTNQTSSVDNRYTFTFLLDHCKEINHTDLEVCISEDSFAVTDFLTTATFEMRASSLGHLNTSAWTEDIDTTANGRYFTWSPKRLMSPNWSDLIFLSTYKNFKFYIFVHDINFSFISTNPLGTTTAFWEFDGNSMKSHYQEIILVEHKKLNLDHRPCEEARDYSFKTCIKESIADAVGCRMPWDGLSRQDRAICTDREQFKQTDMKATQFMINAVDEVESMTGCLKPCSYKEYKFVNSAPKGLAVAAFADDQVSIGIWAVTRHTWVETEVHTTNHQSGLSDNI